MNRNERTDMIAEALALLAGGNERGIRPAIAILERIPDGTTASTYVEVAIEDLYFALDENRPEFISQAIDNLRRAS